MPTLSAMRNPLMVLTVITPCMLLVIIIRLVIIQVMIAIMTILPYIHIKRGRSRWSTVVEVAVEVVDAAITPAVIREREMGDYMCISLSLYIYIYMCMHINININIYIYKCIIHV